MFFMGWYCWLPVQRERGGGWPERSKVAERNADLIAGWTIHFIQPSITITHSTLDNSKTKDDRYPANTTATYDREWVPTDDLKQISTFSPTSQGCESKKQSRLRKTKSPNSTPNSHSIDHRSLVSRTAFNQTQLAVNVTVSSILFCEKYLHCNPDLCTRTGTIWDHRRTDIHKLTNKTSHKLPF